MCSRMSEVHNKYLSAERYLFLCCVLLGILKLLLVNKEEIMALVYPYDDLNYVQAAQSWYWFGHTYNYMMYIHQAIYAFWVALVHASGIPLRVAIELVFLLGAFCLARALLAAGVLWYVCAACFAVTAFHPVSFQLFNRVRPETLYAAVLLFAMAAMIAMWVKRNTPRWRRYALLTGAALALLWNIRPENILITALLTFLAVVSWAVRWRAGEGNRKALRRTAAMVLIPVLFIVAVTGVLATANFLKIGLFVTTEMEAPGFTALCKALLRIKPSKSFRMVPITTEARQMAYSVSPTFAKLKPELENTSAWVYPKTPGSGVQGQVIAAHIYWFLREAVAQAGQFQSARQADAFFAQAAREINKGLAEGRLPKRFVAVNFFDPKISDFLPYLPGSFENAVKLWTTTIELPRVSNTLDLNFQRLYDDVANRRSALLAGGVSISGWAAAPSGQVEQILLRTSNGETLASTTDFLARPGVARFFAARGIRVPMQTGFALNTSQRLAWDDTSLVFETNHGSYTVSLNTLNQTRPGLLYNIESAIVEPIPLQRRIQTRIWRSYGRGVRLFTWAALGGAILLAVGAFRKRNMSQELFVVVLLLLFVVLTRFSLFVLLDASSWPAIQDRYFFPVMPLYSCCLLIVIEEALRLAFRWISPARPVSQLPIPVEAYSAE